MSRFGKAFWVAFSGLMTGLGALGLCSGLVHHDTRAMVVSGAFMLSFGYVLVNKVRSL